MSHYSVYKIWSEKGDLVYYGSTNAKRGAIQRWHHHKKLNYSKCNSKYLFEAYGIENCLFEVLENCASVDEMRHRENWYILNCPCVNKNPVFHNPEKRKAYLLLHKEDKRMYDIEHRKTLDKTTHVCECGGSFKMKHKSTHEKTALHLAYVKKE
jgi:hypothetical protein